jgi:hypothetical protein
MKLAPILGRVQHRGASLAYASCFVLVAACGSAQKPDAPSAASPNGKTAAEEWAERKAAVEAEQVKRAPRGSADPLAMNSELEESAIPKTDITPKGQVRAKSPGELNAAMNDVKASSSVESAAKRLTARLGKPTWIESPKGQEKSKRRIWVAPVGNQCHRLVLDSDGTALVETASQAEWRMLAATARQNPCSGEIKRGLN